MKRKIASIGALLALVVGGAFGVNAAVAGPGQGHTPVIVCHWVPADPHGAHQIPGPSGVGGSYVVIVVDDDGSTGNGPQKAHLHHENDRFGSESCGQED